MHPTTIKAEYLIKIDGKWHEREIRRISTGDDEVDLEFVVRQIRYNNQLCEFKDLTISKVKDYDPYDF